MAVTYFGNTDLTGITYDSGNGGLVTWNGADTFTCPGTGTQNVLDISAYLRLESASGNVRLAIYSSDGSTLICQGTAEIAVTGSGGWIGHVGAANITPNPAQLTGGTNYKVAMDFDSNTVGQAKIAGSAGDFLYTRPADDYTTIGFPASLPAPSNSVYHFRIRAGVEPAAGAAVISGTATEGITEADIVAGGKTIIVTLSGDTLIAS